ncbi:MAG: histidine triad family protein [Nocardioidaceae bacterium]|jgi:histidine triad (HIT) family protein|nr:histidine triad family protein [Nocardioidaceae bacterium]
MSAGASDDCLFCKIVAGEIPAETVLETDRSVAFRDLNPQAPTHVLVIPKLHQPNVAALAEHDPAALADLMETVAAVAESEGLEGHYRLVFNTGSQVGQTVFHVHGHVLGGRSMGWPPG